MSDLSKQINIGKETEARLLQVGIMSYGDFVSMGAESAFIRLRIVDSGACLSLLYGLEGSIEGVPWRKLPEYRKAELRDFFNQLQRTQNPHLTTS